ncbi:hypothetical protein Tco_1287301 [Tanacetum coccineum]
MNQNFDYSNSFSFDQIQPPQQFDNHQPQEIPEVIPFIESETKNELYKMMEAYTERMNQQREQEALLAEQEVLAQKQAAQEKEEPPQKSDFRQLIEEMCGTKASAEQKQKLEEMMLEFLERLSTKRALFYISLNNTPQISPVIAITPDLPTEEPEYSLSMGDEHLSTIPEMELFPGNKIGHTLIDSSLKFDYFLDEFSGELAHIDPIPPGIKEADFDLEEEICLVENLSLSLSISIPVEDSDSHMEEIDLFLASDDSMPPGIENDDYDSEGDIRFLEELLSNDPLPLPEIESSSLDHFNDPSSLRPPPEPPDVEICLNFEPDAGILTTKMVKGISEHYVLMPNTLPTLPTLDPESDFTPSHDSLGSKNNIFDPGIFIEV